MPVLQMKEFVVLARTGSPSIPERVAVPSEHRARLFERINELNVHYSAPGEGLVRVTPQRA